MTEILPQLLGKVRVIPRSVEEFLALSVSRSLGDEAHARDYLLAATRFSAQSLLGAFSTIRSRWSSEPSSADQFRALLTRFTGYGRQSSLTPLLAIRIGRRSVALAVFSGLKLEYTQLRELTSDPLKADTSCAAFIRQSLERFPTCSVAIEKADSKTRQGNLCRGAVALIREAACPLWEVETGVLLSAFAAPPCRNRAQFRAVVAGIWPTLPSRGSGRALLDSVGLGLWVQTRRLLDSQIAVEQPA